MTLFLTSSPCIGRGEGAVLNPANGFVERLRQALPREIRCLFICSDPDAGELSDRIARDMEAMFRQAEMPFGERTVLDGRNADEAAKWVARSNFLILAGGHVPTQNAFFRRIGLAALLRGWDGVILGISAGSMNSAAEVYAHPELDGEAVDPDYRRFLPGLGLTRRNILPHYNQWQGDSLDGLRLLEDIAVPDSSGRQFLILVDGSYLYAENGREEVLGEAYSLEDGVMTQLETGL